MGERKRIRFVQSGRRIWHHARQGEVDAWTCGYAFAGDALLAGDALGAHLLRVLDSSNGPAWTQGGADRTFSELDGNFAAVVIAGGKALAAVDAIRSIPLLIERDGSAIRDGAAWPASTEELDPCSLAEFAAAGYVTGEHTLYRSLRGLQAGECCLVNDGAVSPSEYYAYRTSPGGGVEPEELLPKMDGAFVHSFERLLKSIGSKPLAVPLSGGLDSRLVAAMLKRLGRDDVVCFTYGREGNPDSMTSKRIAERLGYPWIYVPYTRNGLCKTLGGGHARAYEGWAHGGVSLPHLDDFTALATLVNKGVLEPGTVVVPGHTGDFICGSHLKYVFEAGLGSEPDFRRSLLFKHYVLWGRLASNRRTARVFERRMDEAVAAFGGEPKGLDAVAAAYEFWEWRERQAKYIVNAVRSYEHFGLEWRLPLWDREIMDIFACVPLALKMGKRLYRRYLVANDPFGVFSGEAPEREPWRYTPAGGQSSTAGSGVARWKQQKRKHRKDYFHDPLGMPLRYPSFSYRFLNLDKRNYWALQCRDLLRRELGLPLGGIAGLMKGV